MTIPIVPLAAFRSLIGEALSGQLDELLKRKDAGEVVLFSDPPGAQLALVSVGPGRRFERLADVGATEIDGLRALCAVRSRQVDGGAGSGALATREKELEQLEASLTALERYIAECEQRLAEVGQNLSEREAMLEQREQQLLAKERDFFRRGGEVARQTVGDDAGGGR